MNNLSETYKKRINKVIKEEFGISQELHGQIIPRFEEQLKAEIQKASFQIKNGVKCRQGNFRFNCGDAKNTNFLVTWFVYYFSTNKEYEEYTTQHDLGSYVINDSKMMFFNLVYVNGKPLAGGFYDTVAHEFEHLYQMLKMGHEFGGQYVYALAASNLRSADDYKRCLAHIVYASTKSEQEAMINGFYNELANGQVYPSEIENGLSDSECGAWLKNLYQAYQFLKKHNDQTMAAEIGEYHKKDDKYNYNYFCRIAEFGIRSFERRIGRLVYGFKSKVFPKIAPKLKEGFDVLNGYYLID